MEEQAKEALKELGLCKNEIEIYIDLVKTGKSNITDIAKRTGIHRTNVYDSIKKLIDKGFLTETYYNNKKFYYPLNPKYLIDYYKQKEKQIKKVIFSVEKIYNNPDEERKIFILNGVKAIKNMIRQIFEEEKNIFLLGSLKDLVDILEKFNKKSKNIKIIYTLDEEKKLKPILKNNPIESRFLTSDFSTTVTTIIARDKMVIILWETTQTAIFFKDKPLVDLYKKYFLIIWEEAKIEIL